MSYQIDFAPEAAAALRSVQAFDRVRVLEAIEKHLHHEPMRTSRSRIKALRDMRHPQYRLRVGELRVFYDVEDDRVEILAVVTKAEAARWLELWGITAKEEGNEQ